MTGVQTCALPIWLGDGICDPAGDPHPANVGKKKEEKGESVADPLEGVRGYEWVGRFSDGGAVEGNVFKKDGTYYMVFDGTEQIRDFIDDVIVADGWGIVMGHYVHVKSNVLETLRAFNDKFGIR